MRSIKLTLAYDGTSYVGWQVQPNGPSIQAELESAWQATTGENIRIVASGRTDAGVHAIGQVCSLETQSNLQADRLRGALNWRLPEDIAVLKVEDARRGFHALNDAVSKRYRYLIDNSVVGNLFLRRYAWHVSRELDMQALSTGAQLLVGEHDFAAFQATGSPRVSTVRKMHSIKVAPLADYDQAIAIETCANGYLYHMVRNIVGSLVQVGLQLQPVSWIQSVMQSRDRQRAGVTAPAHGLCLMSVDF